MIVTSFEYRISIALSVGCGKHQYWTSNNTGLVNRFQLTVCRNTQFMRSFSGNTFFSLMFLIS